jgi:cell division septation protein DedD
MGLEWQPAIQSTSIFVMSRDFAKKPRGKSRSSSSSNSSTPTWLWFVLGLILGAFGTSLYFIKNPVTTTTPPKIAEKPKVENNTPKPRFDFYKLLQESETIVPASETNRADKPLQTAADSNIEYIIQVGSFPKAEDADKLRAQLILLNLDARVERVELRKSEIWHRVLVGPFATQSALTTARAQLVKNEYNALVFKREKNKR